MNICFICSEYPPGPHGGIGSFTQTLSRALVAQGHGVRVIGVYASSYPGLDFEDDHGVKVWRYRLNTSRGRWILSRYHLYRYIREWAYKNEIDLVEAPDYLGWVAFWPELPIPIVSRSHGSITYFTHELNRNPSFMTTLLERASLRRSDYWCSVSNYTAKVTEKLINHRAVDQVIYNSIDISPAIRVNGNLSRDIIYVGTLTEKKGVISLIKAWNTVIYARPEAKLHLYGKDGNHKSSSMQGFLETLIEDHARGSVHFHGHTTRARVFEALRTARAAVFPSYSEAFAMAPLEALACGCPTVFTKRSSGPELIDNGENGLLIDPDKPNEIADAIICLLEDEELAHRLREAGSELVRKRFSMDVLLPQNVAFYERCVTDFNRKRRS